MALVAQTSTARTVSLSAVAVAAAVAVPFLVHLAPGGSSIGTTLLPIFWTPLLAVLLFGPVPGVSAALLAPILNHWITGMPPSFLVPTLTAELAVFVGLLLVFAKTKSLVRTPFLAPLAYLVARLVVGAVFLAIGSTSGTFAGLFTSLPSAIPGVLSLLVVNALALLALRRKS